MEALQLKEVLLNKTRPFHILDCTISLFSSETSYGWKTVGEIGGAYHYLNDELITIGTAIDLYQYLNNRLLTKAEIRIVMEDNKI